MKIAQWINTSPWGDINTNTLNKIGLGGRESALVQLHENWNKIPGVECISFVPIEKTSGNYVKNDAARTYLENFEVDVLVSWEDTAPMTIESIRNNVKFSVIEMQVAHLYLHNDQTRESLDRYWDAYCCLSRWAGDFFSESNPEISSKKIKILPNGVDISRFPERKTLEMPKGPFKFVYSSSPDRGLINLLESWDEIRQIFPGSELYVCYGAEKWINDTIYSHSVQGEHALKIKQLLNAPGVIYKGKIGQEELAALQISCDALLYPCDTYIPTETGCITAVEAGASYTPMILGAVDCLPSEFGECAEFVDIPFDKEQFVEKVRNLMTDESLYIDLMMKGRAMALQRDWSIIAEDWIKWFKGELNERRSYAQAA